MKAVITMIPILIGAAIGGAGAAAYKYFNDEHEKISHEATSTRYLSKSDVPPDVVKKVRRLERLHLLDNLRNKKNKTDC